MQERKKKNNHISFFFFRSVLGVMLLRTSFLLHHPHIFIPKLAYKNERWMFSETFKAHLFTFQRTMSSQIEIVRRPSHERGHADHGWLKSFHTWSFASYHDPRFTSHGCLRVLNEDRVQPTTGFDTHSHQEYEIFSYVVDGELQHKDSMGNTETIHRGEVQFTSAGTGIQHSEYNVHKSLWVHFIQIWVKPNQARLKPSYTTKKWSNNDKINRL